MKSAVQILIALLLVLFPQVGFSVTVEHLSDVNVPVKSQSYAQRQSAIKTGLRQVILKHVGDTSVFQNAVVNAAFKNPTNLMNQFSYLEKDDELYLKVQFSEQKVIELLRKAQVPIWGKNRPLTIAWVAYDDGVSNSIISDSSHNEFIQNLKSESEAIGLPTVLPILDFDEVTNISVSDIKGSFVNQLHSFNERYGVEYYTLITLNKTPQGFAYQVKLYPQQQEGILRSVYTFSGKAKDNVVTAEQILKPLASFFSKEYSVTATNENSSTVLEFVNVDNLQKAIKIERYLNAFSTVKSAHIQSIKNNLLAIEISLYGKESDMYKTLRLDPKITQVEHDSTEESVINHRYIWK